MTRNKLMMVMAGLAGLALAPACNKSGGSTIPEAARQEARMVYDTRCTTCHGPRGAGDGPGSAALTPKPRNFQDKAWQTSITDAQIETIIKGGGLAVGKSPAMPPNPDLDAKPQVVAALREHIRSLTQ
jgi:mono/diheme cytochrome c family protein